MNLQSQLLALGLLLGMAVFAAHGAEDPPFRWPDEVTMARLAAGEAVLEDDASDEQGAAASILILVQSPVEKIWTTITSCRDALIFLDGLQFCEVLEDSGRYAVTHQIVDRGWTTPRLDYTFETSREPYRIMTFRLVSGNLRVLQGTWEFAALPDSLHQGGILVRHLLVLRPIVPAPRWLVRRSLKKNLPEMMRCIRGLSQGSGSLEAESADLGECPGKLSPGEFAMPAPE